MGPISKITIFLGFSAFFLSGSSVSAETITVRCPAGSILNDCVAQACQNPDGGQVLLEAGEYDATNFKAALNVVNNFPTNLPPGIGLCQGGVSIVGQGADLTTVTANGPNTSPIAGAPPLPGTLAIGSPNGSMGPVEVRDLTLRCATAGTCSLNGIAVINAASTLISGVHVTGFVRGILAAGHNFTVRGNHLEGVGVNVFNGRGIFAVHPFAALMGRQTNLNISDNELEGFFRGIVTDSYDGVKITGNALSAVPQAIFAQNIEGELLISRNSIVSADIGIIANLALFDLVTFEGYGNTPSQILHNSIVDTRIAVTLQFEADFEAAANIHHNSMIDVEKALAFDVDVTPPNFPPNPQPATYDPCLHDVSFKHNVVEPLSALPDLGVCE